jgi:acyl dehydratase
MPHTNCLTAAMIEVGMTHQARVSFSRDDVARYCALADDRNAIHHDLAAARLRFPGVDDIVVPGGLIQIAITGLFGSQLPGDGSLGLSFEPERMRKPVLPGETVVITLEVTRLRGPIVEFKVDVTGAAGQPISTATARVLSPDASYRAWWEGRRSEA